MLKCEHQISQSELLDVLALRERCCAVDGNAIPVYPNLLTQLRMLPCNVLYYEKEQLIGFASVYFFYEDQCELVILVDPSFRRKGVASKLFATLIPVILQRNMNRVLCATPHGLNGLWLTAHGYEKINAECRMQFQGPLAPLPLPEGISFSRATLADLPTIVALNQDCFLHHNPSMIGRFTGLIHDPEYRLFLIYKDQEIVGKAHIFLGHDHACLSDIAIFKRFQGQGFGTLIVAYCIQYLQQIPELPIFLDVDQSNSAALRVYHKLGFNVMDAWDYWSGQI